MQWPVDGNRAVCGWSKLTIADYKINEKGLNWQYNAVFVISNTINCRLVWESVLKILFRSQNENYWSFTYQNESGPPLTNVDPRHSGARAFVSTVRIVDR